MDITINPVWSYGVVKFVIIGPSNGLSLIRRHAVIWTNDAFINWSIRYKFAEI